MSENRNDLTIGELPTRAPGEMPLPEPMSRKREPDGEDWPLDPSQTIGELPTRAPKMQELMLLAKRYRVLRRLGEGGMGSVWLAEDTKLDNRHVAIKMLPAVLAGKKAACRQVKQEALMAMKLSHPNIATVRAFEEESGNPFLVMDYIDGEGLDDILDDKGKLSEAETLKLLTPVAAALDYAHGKGVVHRDVKPGNVMVAKDGTPFVLDFGIAREIQETMTRVTGKFSSGTLMYMSPEQLHGKQPRAAQDVYSFAAMAYECLKGEPPFAHGQVEYQIDHDVPEPLKAGMASVALGEGIMAGLSKDPQARPATCAEVLGLGKAAKRAREAREAAEAARRRQEEARLAQERARAEAEKRREEKALAEERAARKLAEAKTEKAREEAKKQAMEAFRAQEAQGRALRWIGFLVFVLIVAGVAGAAWWQGEKERLEGNLRDARRQKTELEQQRSQWEDKARKAAGEAEAAKVARQNLERQQAELERQRIQQEEAAKAAADALQEIEAQRAEFGRREAQRAEQERQRIQREEEEAQRQRNEEVRWRPAIEQPTRNTGFTAESVDDTLARTRALLLAGKAADALASIRSMPEAARVSIPATLLEGTALIRLQRYPEAIGLLAPVVQSNTRHAELQAAYGAALMGAKRYDEARNALACAVNLDRHSAPETYANLALLCAFMDPIDLELARRYYGLAREAGLPPSPQLEKKLQ